MAAADDTQDADDERGARRAATRRRARGQDVPASDYRSFLRWSVIGSIIPGVGLVAAGRKRLGTLIFLLFLLGVVGVTVFVVIEGTSGLLRVGTDSKILQPVALGLVALAVLWLLSALASFRALEPDGLRAPQRFLGAVAVVVGASLVVTPLTFGAQSAFTQLRTIDNVFADEDDHSLTVPDDATEEDPWAGKARVNVLILGADSGDDREGTRTDTVMVASIDTKTGRTSLFSLPRNLQYVPFPDDTPMHEEYPDGFHGDPESEFWLYSIYQNIPVQFPEYFADIRDQGAEALKLAVGEALGLDLDYYVMVNLRGFQYLVDAFGGIDIDVPYDIPIGTRSIPGVGCSEESGWIREGDDQHLSGYQALWFARARCGPGPVSDDYERMRRQRCVIGAIAAQADPFTLLTRYQQLASATEKTMSTDISQQRLTAFAELALKVQKAGINSLPFTNAIVDYYDPDYDVIRQFVKDSLAADAAAPTGTTAPTPTGTGNPTGDPSGDPSGDPTGDPTDDPTGDPADEGDEEGGPGDESGEGGEDGEDEADPTPTPGETNGAQDIAEVC